MRGAEAEDAYEGPKMPVRLFNSLHRRLDDLDPMHDNAVRMYTCGPTVYNYAHIGNLRAYLFADALRRTLQWSGFDVTQIINITDVGHLTSDADEGDDKVELAARSANRSAFEITQRYTQVFFDDLESLNVRPAAMFPRATQHIQEMIDFIKALELRGYTYHLKDGLYFDTSKVSNYGQLGALDLEAQLAGARVAADPEKRQPWDFSLWRLSPPGGSRLMEWDSPWGRGFPGWHIECSVMSLKYLAGPFDIHTGGIDHRQVHHPNEMAQNQAYLSDSQPGSNIWMHSEFLIMKDKKMSKSSGNFWRLSSLVDCGVHPLVYRHFLLQAHYRSQVEFSMEAVVAARVTLERTVRRTVNLIREAGDEGTYLRELAREADFTTGGSFSYLRSVYEEGLGVAATAALREFGEAISDDLGTPKALAVLAAVLADPEIPALQALKVVGSFDLVLGLKLLTLDPHDLVIRPANAPFDNAEVEALVAARQQARMAKEWQRADEIRNQLAEAGVLVQDGTNTLPTTWSWQIRE
ncbi:cysteinyl-tRNA synthetase [Micromonospora sp. Llam0]|uniref:cysteine--tRNA ligase n=1 Tax=Micromonospora sp. Llam0 TaxID=2485143 RepID=UPI000FB5D6BF|nr:cysteine--tRNA ligase [Micromonospora sp. Llam0]ROO52672.1 cysteinyl-tRNA synthetase [Micromonospora sp. Llam0]